VHLVRQIAELRAELARSQDMVRNLQIELAGARRAGGAPADRSSGDAAMMSIDPATPSAAAQPMLSQPIESVSHASMNAATTSNHFGAPINPFAASQLSHQLANPAAMSAISDSDLATQHKIFLREQDLTDFDATLIAQFLKTNTTVTLVDLSDNFISNAGTTSISDSLRTNTSVQRLVVYNNGIEDQGASAIAEAVMSNHSLLVVEMSENSIRDPGATALANALKINSSVTDLGLSVNGIGDSGASELAECVRSNSTLRVLTLDFNNVGSDGGRALASAINLNRGLTEVNLSNNAFGDEVRTLLSQVASNRQINIKF